VDRSTSPSRLIRGDDKDHAEDDRMHRHTPDMGFSVSAQLAARNVMLGRMRERIAATRTELPEESAGQIGPYVAISRLHGSGGAELAQRVGATLGWPVLDRAVLEMVAKQLNVEPNALVPLDQGAASWFTDVLGEVMPIDIVSRDTYTDHLRRVFHLLATPGRVVFLGRAAHLFLPRERGLSVRVVADLEDRVARIRARDGVDEARALADIEAVDKAREHFIWRTFNRKPSDPDLYDLVVSSTQLPIDVLADVVVTACRRHLLATGEPAGGERAVPIRPADPAVAARPAHR
jgi:hypothetical protein